MTDYKREFSKLPNPYDAQYIDSRLKYLEEERRFISSCLEEALSLGDFQEEVRREAEPAQIVSECESRIRGIIEFDTRAIYLVNESTMDLDLWLCSPMQSSLAMEKQIHFMVFGGFVAWAVRECRGITVPSKDRSHEIMLHVIATNARIRGLFVGILPPGGSLCNDISLQLLSIILRSTANALESVEYCRTIRDQKLALQEKVDYKAKEVLRYERQLQRAQKMEALGTLAGGVAHDLNNVLTGMVSYPDLLLMQLPEDSPLRKPILTIRESGKKAAAIVQDLLTLARRGMKNNALVFNINRVINDYLSSPEMDRLRAQNLFMLIKTDLDKNLLNIKGSPLHIYKVVMNLVSNAAEAMTQGGEIHISTFNRYIDLPVKGYEEIAGGEYAALRVADTGEGISIEDRERIFEPFYILRALRVWGRYSPCIFPPSGRN
jgi:signal transduction histidine kinase